MHLLKDSLYDVSYHPNRNHIKLAVILNTHVLTPIVGFYFILKETTPNDIILRGCELIIGFDNRYCAEKCPTSESLKRYLTAYLQSKSSNYPTFPFKVAAIKDAESKFGEERSDCITFVWLILKAS